MWAGGKIARAAAGGGLWRELVESFYFGGDGGRGLSYSEGTLGVRCGLRSHSFVRVIEWWPMFSPSCIDMLVARPGGVVAKGWLCERI